MSIMMSPGEIFDRYTILRMKSAHMQDDASMLAEAKRFGKEVGHIIRNAEEQFLLVDFLLDLVEANAKIWLLESAIREPVNGELAHEDVGRRAIEIRNHNKKRVIAKKSIDNMFGVTPDIKVNHASE